MKVVGISSDKQVYNPGDTMILNVVAQWEILDTGGVIYLQERGEGESIWRLLGTQDVGSPGIGIPNIGMMGKDQTVAFSVIAPDTPGYYQMGAREQSQSEVPTTGAVQIQVVPETPSTLSNQGVVHITTNIDNTGDTVLYVDDVSQGILPASGYYLEIRAGKHIISAYGSQYSAAPVTVQVVSGSSQTVFLPLGAGGAASGGMDWTWLAIGAGAAIGIVALLLIMKRGEE